MLERLRELFTPTLLWGATALSIGLFLASALAIPWLLRRLPHDYFTRDRTPAPVQTRHPFLHAVLVILRNVVGVLLLLAGVAMLVLPGQGLLSIFASLFLIDFPGKRRLQRRIVAERHVFGAINRLRVRLGCPPLDQPRLD